MVISILIYNKNTQKMKTENILNLILLLSVFLLFSTIAFGVPSTLTLQGKLTNKAGASQSGTFSMAFRIYSVFNYTTYVLNETVRVYNESSGGYYNSEANITYINYTDIIWEKNKSITTDSNGVYDIILDGVNLSFSDQYYLGITVANDNESTPRINLSAAPYSFRANISEGLNPNQSYTVNNLSVTGNVTIGSGVTTLLISTQSFNLTMIGNINLANNMTLGDAITFRYGQFIENPVKGMLKINSSLNVTGNFSVNINTLFVDSLSGNVGIGTIFPGRALEVSGSINGTQLNISGPVNLAYGIGNVGIGTSNAGSKLTVIGGVNITGGLNVTTGDVLFGVTSGKVGINTTVPAQTLTIEGTLNITSQPTRSGDLFVASNGNVGIGTTSPLQRLEVSGNVLVNNTANAFLNLSGPIVRKSGSDIVISD